MIQKQVIAESIDYLVAHYQERPDLEFLARRAGYDVSHFQKMFKEHVGISPKRLCQYMHMRHARDLLGQGYSTLDAAYGAGLSGQGRLHDLFVNCEGMTPGAVKDRGRGLRITYGFAQTPLGEMLLAKTDIGVCYLGFLVDGLRDKPVSCMKKHWPLAHFIEDDSAIEGEAEKILSIWSGVGDASKPLKLDLYGTNWQLQVWQALLRIPAGKTVTYMDIAEEVCTKKASRAVGNAVGANPISLLIPCHRVIRATGIIDNYNWGSSRKKLLLAMEASQL